MSNRPRMQSSTFGASSSRSTKSTKKRPLTPAAPSTFPKRCKSGPFVVDSSSGEDEDSDDDDSHDGDDGDGDDGDDEDGFSYNGHISAAPKRPGRNGTNRVEKPDEGNSILTPRASFQQQTPSRAPERRLSALKAASTPCSGNELNKERLKMMLARKQGTIVAQSPMQQRAPQMSMGMGGIDPRSRPWNDRSLSEDQLTFTEAQDKSSRNISPFTRARPEMGRPASSSFGEIPSNQVQDTKPNLLSRTTEVPVHKAPKPFQGSRASIKQQLCPSDTHIKPHAQPAASLRQPYSSTLRTANAGQPHNAANKSSLRNILDTAKAGHSAAAVEHNKIGKKWQKAKTGRVPTRSAKKVKRPGVGARYGHTLTAGKTSDAEKGNVGMTGTRPIPADAKSMQTPVSRSSVSPGQSHPASPRAEMEMSTPKPVLDFESSPASQPCAENLSNSAPNARQNSINPPLSQNPRSTVSRNEARLTTSPIARGQDSFRVHNQITIPPESSPKERTPVQAFGKPGKASMWDMVDSDGFVKETTWRKSEQTVSDAQASTSSVKDAHLPRPQSPRLSMTQPQLSPATANVLSLDQGKALFISAVQPQRGYDSSPTTCASANEQGYNNVKTVDMLHKSSTIPLSGAAKPSSSHASSRPRAEIPVAVMIRPPQKDDTRSLSTGSMGSTEPAATEVLETGLNFPNASPSSNSEQQSSTVEVDARASTPMAATIYPQSMKIKEDAVSGVPDDMNHSANHQDPARFEAITQTPLPVDVPNVAVEEQSAEVLEPIVSQSTEPIDGAHEEPAPPVACSQGSPQTALRPPNPPSPASAEEMAYLIASATLLSPRPATNLPSLKTPQVQDAFSKLTSTISAVPASATASLLSTSPDTFILPPPTTSPTAEPYFEYSIHQTVSSPGSDDITTEISAQPLSSADAANAQTELLLQTATRQYRYADMDCKSTTTTITVHGLLACEAEFANTENPSLTLTLKIQVARNVVGVHGSLNPISTPLLSRSIYALRLWRLLDAPSRLSSPAPSSDSDSSTSECRPRIRTHHPLPAVATELYTTLEAANRAARRVQLALSHEVDPKDMQRRWQIQDLRELSRKLEGLRGEGGEDVDGKHEEGRGGGSEGSEGRGDRESTTPSLFEYEAGRRRGCWRSVFNGIGLGADTFEVLVARVGISGPRNL